MKKHLRLRTVLALCLAALAVILISSCSPAAPSGTPGVSASAPVLTAAPSATPTPTPSPSPSPTPTPAPLNVAAIEVVADPSVAAADLADPYTELNKYMVEIYHPDKQLYNDLFKAVMSRQKSFDSSGYRLSLKEKTGTAGCLYGEAEYRFFYLKYVSISSDGKKVTFTYTKEKADSVKQHSAEFAAHLAHVLYNVLPEDYTDLQKLASLYDYLCRTSDYAKTTDDPSLFSPYSILMQGQGICNGYANLTQYALSRAGLDVDYVCDEAHAWDVVKLNGNWYCTDTTWGVGRYQEPVNWINTLLMDDTQRMKGLTDAGYGDQPIILGYPGGAGAPPPPCTDKRFEAYASIYRYALDIDGNKVYYGGQTGLEQMNLDCTDRKTLLPGVSPALMAFFNGTIYYVDATDNQLYSLVPGSKPAPVPGGEQTLFLKLDGATMKFGQDASGEGATQLDLLPLNLDGTLQAETLPSAAIPAGRTFCVKVKFTQAADNAQNWNELVYLADAAGKAVPLHFSLSKDGTELTVRPKDCLDSAGSLSIIIMGGIRSIDGASLEKACRMDITIGEP